MKFFFNFQLKFFRLTQTTSIIKNTKENSRYSQSTISNKNSEQIEKIILELIQTEKSYIHVS